MDASRRPQLPALSYLDIDKVKREEEYYQHRHTGSGASQSLSSSAGASPTYHYPPGPPPPYSHAHGVPPPPTTHTNNWSGTQHVVPSPQGREHDREGAKQNARQSLPSISEALGVDRQTTFATSQSQPPPPPPSVQHSHSHISRPTSTAPASPPVAAGRSYPMEPPPPSSYPSGGSTYSQFPQYRPESTQKSSYPPVPGSAPEEQPAARVQVPQAGPPPPASYPRSTESYEPPLPPPPPSQAQPAGTMAPPAVPYGYTPYPPRYANSTPAPPPAPAPPTQSVSSGPIYQPSTLYAPPQSEAPTWKAEANARYEDRQSGPAAYGDNVKRHLDFYDLESALNEIASTSGILSDFSRRYGDRMHHTQRSGPALSTLPGIVEVDDMVSKSRVQLDSLLKIRDVILAQQAVYEQQAADQRHHKAFNEPAHQSQVDPNLQESDDGKGGGFAGADAKKRRGRAAPPGRCHSCNRAETPEWRRGPDGARTLCNACGLHYAKLTRKNQGTNKTAATSAGGSSNLRPKENLGQ